MGENRKFRYIDYVGLVNDIEYRVIGHGDIDDIVYYDFDRIAVQHIEFHFLVEVQGQAMFFIIFTGFNDRHEIVDFELVLTTTLGREMYSVLNPRHPNSTDHLIVFRNALSTVLYKKIISSTGHPIINVVREVLPEAEDDTILMLKKYLEICQNAE